MKVACVQFQHRPGDRQYNLDVIRRFSYEAARQGVELIVFPECCLTGYWHLRKLSRSELEGLAETIESGAYINEVRSLAAELGIVIGAGFVELDSADGTLYNSYAVFDGTGLLGLHRKLHCFISEHMASGESFTTFMLPNGRTCGVLICYDNNLIENVRATALAGAEILLAPHQTGGCDSGSPCAMGLIDTSLWDNRDKDREPIENEFRGDKGRGWLMRWLPSRAHDNGLFLLFSNGVGVDDNEVRTGNAMILDPYGRIIEETWRADDDMVVGELDFSLRASSTGVRWMRARRPELYSVLSEQPSERETTREVRFEHLD